MSELEIKHYMRRKRGDDEQTLVIERVGLDSETARFLVALEEKRKVRPCHWSIDMRGKVAAECSNYLINNKVFYLDPVSYAMFQKGLRDNNGVFTQGTYEAIVNGGHTNKALRAASEQQARHSAPQSAAGVSARPAATAASEASPRRPSAPDYQPECLPFGYFRKRKEPRLQYVTGVSIQAGDLRSNAKTRDISPSGLQIYAKGFLPLREGDQLRLDFSELDNERHADVLRDIPYCVVTTQQRPNDITLRLQRLPCERDAEIDATLDSLLAHWSARYKYDVDDDLQTVSAQLYERLYTDNLAHVPLFIAADEHGDLYLDKVAGALRNRQVMEFFRCGDSHDFSALCLPQRLRHLATLAESADGPTQDMLLVLYRQQDAESVERIHSAADFELASPVQLLEFLRFAMVHDRHLFIKLQARRAELPTEHKLQVRAERLGEKSREDLSLLQAEVSRMRYVAMLADVTATVTECVNGMEYSEGVQEHLDSACCWVGHTRRDLLSKRVRETLAEPPHEPELIRFGYIERRREERYLIETEVEVRIGRNTYTGSTRDLSTRGLCMTVAVDIDIDPDTRPTASVNFVKLQQKVGNVPLNAVEYRIVGLARGAGSALMMERVVDRRQEKLNAFFVDLIARNRHKLQVDLNETLYAAKSRIYEAIVSENLINLPVFLARREDGGLMLRGVGMNEAVCPTAAFFQNETGFDFTPLLDTRRVHYLYDGITLLTRREVNDEAPRTAFDMDIYLMQRDRAVDGERFASLSDAEQGSGEVRQRFIEAAFKSGRYRFFRLSVTPVTPFKDIELDSLLEGIREQSRHRAFQLKEEVLSVLGQGELVDITAQLALMRQDGTASAE